MDFDSTDVVRRQAQLPPEQVQPKPTRSAWGAPFRAVKAAVADVAGSVADVVQGYGAAGAIVAEADPVAMATMADQVKRGADEGRAQIASGEAMVSDIGTSFRNVSESLRPDPATASTAEKLIFPTVKTLTKLGVGAAFGPMGIGFASAEEGVTQAEELRRQGVDLPTRTAVGAVTAGFTAASAYLPASGTTIKSTAALYLAGGPGGFMAQQKATREILAAADYDELARQYDPLDPVGLAVSSLVPLPFAAYGLAKARGGIGHETVDAAMAHNLTALADDVEARGAPQIDPAPVPRQAMPEMDAPPKLEVDDIEAVRARVAEVETENPAAKAEMDKVRKLVAEGADDELGTLDADLLRVAAECALSLG